MNRITSVSRLSLLVLKSCLRDIRFLAVTFGLPLFMLFTFWITTRDDSPESSELFRHMVPAICAMAVMMPGQTQAARLSGWRENGTMRRLALSPVPLSVSIIGITVSQIVLSVIQGFLLYLICLSAVGVWPCINGIALLFIYIVLISTAFLALGSLLSALFTGPAITGYAFFAVFLPMFFLGSFPPEHLPPGVRVFIPWLPTSMGIRLVDSLFEKSSALPLFNICGLLIFSLLFLAAAALVYRKRSI